MDDVQSVGRMMNLLQFTRCVHFVDLKKGSYTFMLMVD